MSNKLMACDASVLSKVHSSTTAVWKPYELASSTVARTQPLVEFPHTTTESMPAATRCDISEVPKKALAASLPTTSSDCNGASSSTMDRSMSAMRLPDRNRPQGAG